MPEHLPPLSDGLTIRRELRPGDIGEAVALHGACYAAEHGLDCSFETYVAGGMAAAVDRGWPNHSGKVWIGDRGGRLVGLVALTHEEEGRGRLRWFLVHPDERGSGLGRRLLRELVRAAAAEGYRTVELETFDGLGAAARLYAEAGFRCIESRSERRWGRMLVVQRYELRLETAAIRGAA